MDFGLFVTVGLAALTCFFAGFAIFSEWRSNDIDRDDGPLLKSKAKIGMWCAIGCGVLAFGVAGINALSHGPAGNSVPAQASNLDQPIDLPKKSASEPQPNVPTVTPQGSGTIASNTTPAAPPPTFDTGMQQQNYGGSPPTFNQPISNGSGYTWESPTAPARTDRDDHDRDRDRHPPKIVFPYTPVTFTVVMRFSTEDPAIKSYVDRVVRQAERDSGIALSSSGDKFSSLRITPNEAIVYADGKQARINRSQNYVARSDEAAARRYLFAPPVHVTLAQESGTRATFAKTVGWETVKREHPTDMLDLYVFPKRKRVVLTVTASCLPAQGQFPDGAPSVYDLRGGTVAVQLEKIGDLAGPKPVDLDEVDRHGADESMRLEASMAPRVKPTILSILCATSPQGSIELGVDDATIERSSLDRETAEVCGPVSLVGFPEERPHS